MIGWSGCPDATAENPTVARGWQCALTVPRELSMRDGKLCQQPAHEIERMRGDCVRTTGGETVEEPGRLFDLVVSCEGAKMVELEIRKGVFVRYADGMLTLDMGDEGYGRDQRSIELGELRDLRVLSDTTMVEIFANGGEAHLRAVPIRRRFRRWRCTPRARRRWISTASLINCAWSTIGLVGRNVSQLPRPTTVYRV